MSWLEQATKRNARAAKRAAIKAQDAAGITNADAGQKMPADVADLWAEYSRQVREYAGLCQLSYEAAAAAIWS